MLVNCQHFQTTVIKTKTKINFTTKVPLHSIVISRSVSARRRYCITASVYMKCYGASTENHAISCR